MDGAGVKLLELRRWLGGGGGGGGPLPMATKLWLAVQYNIMPIHNIIYQV